MGCKWFSIKFFTSLQQSGTLYLSTIFLCILADKTNWYIFWIYKFNYILFFIFLFLTLVSNFSHRNIYLVTYFHFFPSFVQIITVYNGTCNQMYSSYILKLFMKFEKQYRLSIIIIVFVFLVFFFYLKLE